MTAQDWASMAALTEEKSGGPLELERDVEGGQQQQGKTDTKE